MFCSPSTTFKLNSLNKAVIAILFYQNKQFAEAATQRTRSLEMHFSECQK